jgi:UDP:flavonoid glycosyltransferase YjiC (YdhE family)
MRALWFCIPAYGHTNPTIEVVRELTRRGHEVRYYSFEEFRESPVRRLRLLPAAY